MYRVNHCLMMTLPFTLLERGDINNGNKLMSFRMADLQYLRWPARFKVLAGKARDPRLKRYYEAGIAAAETPISATPLVAMDLETTGLDPGEDGIVSIGLVPVHQLMINCQGSKHWILKPREKLSASSVVFHGITHSKISSAPDFLDILEDLLEALSGKVVVVHYRFIERNFLKAACINRIGEALEFPVIDTMDLEARVWRKNSKGVLERLLGRPSVSLRLAASRARYNLPFYGPHDALTDALACAELLLGQIARSYSPQTPVKELWM
jgi:DNA polymerase-3 subunit epsilon